MAVLSVAPNAVVNAPTQVEEQKVVKLTKREIEVLTHVIQGEPGSRGHAVCQQAHSGFSLSKCL
jgi:radical SAM superfamily enzyme